MRNDLRSAARLAAGLALAALPAAAFDFIADSAGPFPIAWNPGSVPVVLRLPVSGPLIDGHTYTSSLQVAIAEWNANLGVIQLAPSVASPGLNTNGDGVNEVVFANTINGSAFPANVLAVALTRVIGTTRAEGDVIFNTAWTWDSYRGPRSAYPDRFDIRRVALHELGHVLGLDHPDEASPPQTVTAIMNSRSGNTDALQSDDIAGVQVLYGVPGVVPANNNFANATVITGDLPLALEGSNVGTNKEPGEPAHAGNSGGRSVWWRWTAPSAGTAAVTTQGSRFDTLLAVYTGSSVSALTQVAANNDATSVRTSAVTFVTTAGTTYHIAVDGVNGDAASVLLNLAFAPGSSTPPPTIRRPPRSMSATPGSTVVFNVDADAASGFQWLFNGQPIAGANGASLTLDNVDASRAGNYQVRLTSGSGTLTSDVAVLTLLPATLPNQIVTTGRSVSFSIPPSNNSVIWQISTNGATWNNLANDSTYSGVTSNTLTISNVTNALNGVRYRYVLTAPANGGSTTGAPATLNVGALVLPFPVGIVADGSGGVFVADSTDDVIYRVSSGGEVTVYAGARGASGSADGNATAARFNNPGGLARDAAGNLYVADTANATIRRIAPDGTVTTLAGSAGATGNTDGTGSAARFTNPVDVTVDPAGNLYVVDSQSHVIRRITSAGVVTTLAGSAGSAGTSDGNGAAARFSQPQGITVGADGNLYVADTGNSTIRRVTPAGDVTTFAGLPGVSGAFDAVGTGALLNQPVDIATGADGNLYVADLGNSTLRRISPDGTVFTIAGLLRTTGQKDGTGREVWFNQPRALAAVGNTITIADTGNAILRRMTGDGTVTALALTASFSPAPSPNPTPNPTPTPTPNPGGGGGGGGGGSPSWIFLVLTLATLLARQHARRCA